MWVVVGHLPMAENRQHAALNGTKPRRWPLSHDLHHSLLLLISFDPFLYIQVSVFLNFILIFPSFPYIYLLLYIHFFLLFHFSSIPFTSQFSTIFILSLFFFLSLLRLLSHSFLPSIQCAYYCFLKSTH